MSGNQFVPSELNQASPSQTPETLSAPLSAAENHCCDLESAAPASLNQQNIAPANNLNSLQAHNKKLLVCITGSIAAYKSVLLVREAVKAGYQVRVALSEAAQQFVTPLTLQALSQNRVYTSLFDAEAELSMGHIELAKWADCIVIAPATANVIGKIAHGFADDLITTLVLAKPEATPLVIAPAMNKEMFAKKVFQDNLFELKDRGYLVLQSPAGSQACGDVGEGRMVEPEEILHALNINLKVNEGAQTKAVGFTCPRAQVNTYSKLFDQYDVADLQPRKKDQITLTAKDISDLGPWQRYIDNFKGKRVLVTAGPTREMIDPVRYITNHSSGKMGIYIAALAAQFGASVTAVCGPLSIEVPPGIRVVKVESAQQMNAAVEEALLNVDVFVGCAAVGDFRAKEISTHKIKKSTNDDELTITLVKNPDILRNVSNHQRRPKYVVGFAAETQDVAHYAKTKVLSKGCDVICANDVSKENQGWNSDFNHLTLFYKDGSEKDLGYDTKEKVAKMLVLDIIKQLYLREHAEASSLDQAEDKLSQVPEYSGQ